MGIRVRAVLCFALAAGDRRIATPHAPGRQQHEAPTRQQLQSLIVAGEYDKAETTARALVSRTEIETGAESLSHALAADLLVEALIRNGKAAQPGTRELATSTLRDKERLLAPDDIQLAASLSNRAATLVAAGELPSLFHFSNARCL